MLALADYYDHLNLKYAYFPPEGGAEYVQEIDDDMEEADADEAPEANVEDVDQPQPAQQQQQQMH